MLIIGIYGNSNDDDALNENMRATSEGLTKRFAKEEADDIWPAAINRNDDDDDGGH